MPGPHIDYQPTPWNLHLNGDCDPNHCGPCRTEDLLKEEDLEDDNEDFDPEEDWDLF